MKRKNVMLKGERHEEMKEMEQVMKAEWHRKWGSEKEQRGHTGGQLKHTTQAIFALQTS